MHLLLLYDIAHDGARGKVACICLDYGLDRIQFSAFAGVLPRSQQKALMRRIQDVLSDLPGRVQLVPIAVDDWERRLELGNAD